MEPNASEILFLAAGFRFFLSGSSLRSLFKSEEPCDGGDLIDLFYLAFVCWAVLIFLLNYSYMTANY